MKTQSCAVRVGYAAALLISVIFAGCTNVNTIPPEPTGTQHIGTDIVVPGRPDKVTMYDLDRLIVETMTKLNKCTEFEEAYNSVREKKNGAKPRLVIANFDNKTSDGDTRRKLNTARDFIKEWLYNSGRFNIRDDDASIVLADSIFENVTGSSEVSDSISAISLDFYLRGRLVDIPPSSPDCGENYQYRLEITMYNLHNGDLLWTGIQKLGKENK